MGTVRGMRDGTPRPAAAATTLTPLVSTFLGDAPPIAIRCWDGSVVGDPSSPATIVIHSPRAVRRLLWSPNELGLGRAYVAGELDVEGDIFATLALRDVLAERDEQVSMKLGWRAWLTALRTALSIGAV